MTIGAFATFCGGKNLIDYFHGMRNISFWIPIVSENIFFSVLLEGRTEYSVVILESERGVLAPSNPIDIKDNNVVDGAKTFDFEIAGLNDGSGINIPQGGSINTNGSASVVKVATNIVAKAMTTTTVNTKINGKNAGKNFSITLKDSKGNALSSTLKGLLIGFLMMFILFFILLIKKFQEQFFEIQN